MFLPSDRDRRLWRHGLLATASCPRGGDITELFNPSSTSRPSLSVYKSCLLASILRFCRLSIAFDPFPLSNLLFDVNHCRYFPF